MPPRPSRCSSLSSPRTTSGTGEPVSSPPHLLQRVVPSACMLPQRTHSQAASLETVAERPPSSPEPLLLNRRFSSTSVTELATALSSIRSVGEYGSSLLFSPRASTPRRQVSEETSGIRSRYPASESQRRSLAGRRATEGAGF